MATTDPTRPPRRAGAPAIPEQRQYDESITQARVDSIFRALVLRRALERLAQEQEPGGEIHP